MKKVSDAELEVLKVIWDKKVATSMEIILELKENKWSDNTVRTLIKRLLQKGAIEIVGKKSKVFYYKATSDKKKFQYAKTKHLLDQIFDGKIENLIVNYLKFQRDKDEKNKEIIRLLKEEIKNK